MLDTVRYTLLARFHVLLTQDTHQNVNSLDGVDAQDTGDEIVEKHLL